jgi:hypothetical protein
MCRLGHFIANETVLLNPLGSRQDAGDHSITPCRSRGCAVVMTLGPSETPSSSVTRLDVTKGQGRWHHQSHRLVVFRQMLTTPLHKNRARELPSPGGVQGFVDLLFRLALVNEGGNVYWHALHGTAPLVDSRELLPCHEVPLDARIRASSSKGPVDRVNPKMGPGPAGL